ncbi:MAG: AAA family ATPase [Vicinamibacterales bacterium]
MRKSFVVVAGLPASGKTTLARVLAPALGLPLIDKDDILERLFASRGIGDATWRRTLSRLSDAILEKAALASDGAILSSFWHVPGMPEDSGSHADWLRATSHRVVVVQCVCPPEVAAARFLERRRHPGHLDGERTRAQILSSLRALSALGTLAVGPVLHVDMTGSLAIGDLVRDIRNMLAQA